MTAQRKSLAGEGRLCALFIALFVGVASTLSPLPESGGVAYSVSLHIVVLVLTSTATGMMFSRHPWRFLLFGFVMAVDFMALTFVALILLAWAGIFGT